MSKHGVRQQKQLAKKRAKRLEKRTELARQSSDDPTTRLAEAASWPVHAALVPENLWDEGIGNVVIARNLGGGRLACAVFLVDVYCLGVKNAFWKILSRGEFTALQRDLSRLGALRPVTPEYVAKLVGDAVAYARALGIAPHPDFRNASLLLAGIDPSLCSQEFIFGQDGKPFYVRGPNESLEKAHEIAMQIQTAGGEYVIPLSESLDADKKLIRSLQSQSAQPTEF